MVGRLAIGLAVVTLAACSNSTSAPSTTLRPALQPTDTTIDDLMPQPSAAPPPTDSFSAASVPLSTGDGPCAGSVIPFRPIALPGWDYSTGVWSGIDPVTKAAGIIEITASPAPAPVDPAPITILGFPGTIGRLTDGFVATFVMGSAADPCTTWSLLAHPQTSLATLRDVAEHLTTLGAGAQIVDCSTGLHGSSATNPGDQNVLGVVDLPVDRALQTSRTTLDDGESVVFAKNGLIVHPGTSFDVVVPPEWQGRIGIGWGTRSQPRMLVHVPACAQPQNATTLDFGGGFYARQTVCAPIDVIVDGKTSEVFIGIGTPCPGQAPVEGPTET